MANAIMSKIKDMSRYVSEMTSQYFNPKHAPTSAVITLNMLVNQVYLEITHIDHVAFVEDSVDSIVEQFWAWSDRKIYSVKEIAQLFGKSCSTIYRWIKQGKLKAQKHKGRWQVIA